MNQIQRQPFLLHYHPAPSTKYSLDSSVERDRRLASLSSASPSASLVINLCIGFSAWVPSRFQPSILCSITSNGCYCISPSHWYTLLLRMLSPGAASPRLVSYGLRVDNRLLRSENYRSSKRKLFFSHASTTQTPVFDPVSSLSKNATAESRKKSNEAALILIRHGESLWNEKNLFTGCVDVPLTQKGVEEAIEAGKRISNIPVDMIYTSALIRAQMTAMLAMTQHRRKKVPIVMHDESEQAKSWSRIHSEETKKQCIPVVTAWQLNERMYGELQGLNKQETADRYGKEKVHEWRRSYDIPPPNGESLEMCAERAVAYFKERIEPQFVAGNNVMIAAHGNSLRSIIMYLDKLTSQEVISLELSTGIPMLYIFKEGKFVRRGSPAGPSEAGVYAYTKTLALYRRKLDEKEMFH